MNRTIYRLLIIPCFIVITVFLIIPLITMMWPTFFDGKITFSRYFQFLGDPFYQSILVRTIKLSLITTGVCVVLGVPTAFYISKSSMQRKQMLLSIILFPLLTNAVVRGFAWMNMLGKNGVLNSMFIHLGLIKQPFSLMYTEFAIVVGSVYLFLPLMITTLTPVMDHIEDEMVEAAMSLGASFRTVFRKIIIPLSFPGIVVGSVLVFTGTLSAYTTPSLLGGNKNMMLATLVYQQVNQLSDWTQASMISVIMIAISILMMGSMRHVHKRLDKRGYTDA